MCFRLFRNSYSDRIFLQGVSAVKLVSIRVTAIIQATVNMGRGGEGKGQVRRDRRRESLETSPPSTVEDRKVINRCFIFGLN